MSTRKEQLLATALIEASCFNVSFPTRDPGYTAQIVKKNNEWGNGKLEAILRIKPSSEDEIPDLMSGDALPIFFWVESEDQVVIHWELPKNDWTNSTISEQWPATPGPFLLKPED